MGQYYNVVIKNKNTITAYTKLLYKNPCQVAWIGDYSQTECTEEINPILFEFAWGDEVEKTQHTSG